MSLYRVAVIEETTVNGWMTVEADGETEAIKKVINMDDEEILDEAEWGSCGDERSVMVDDWVEKIYEPTVSEVLWK